MERGPAAGARDHPGPRYGDRGLPKPLGRVHPRHRSPYLAGLWQTVLGAVCVLAFAAAGADPYTELLLWMNTPGLIGLMGLQLLAALAVPFFFRRIRHQEGALRTAAAPTAAAVLLATAIGLVVTHVDLFSGASSSVNVVLVAIAPATFAVGVGLAFWLRRARPEVYAHFAAEPAEDRQRPLPDSSHLTTQP